MPSTDTHGSAGSTRSIQERSSQRTNSPATIGISTICTMDIAIAPASTGSSVPASHRVSSGVKIGASRVDTEVMVTDSATSPLAR